MEMKELRELPILIKIKEEEARQEIAKKEALVLQLEKINAELTDSILNARDENEKIKYTNELSRKNALSMHQMNSSIYCTARQNIYKVAEKIESIMIDLRLYHNQIRIEEIIARMHKL